MKKILYFLTKPHKGSNLCAIDALICLVPFVVGSAYEFIGFIALIIQIFVLGLGYYVCQDLFDKKQKTTLLSTIVIAVVLLVFIVV